MTGRKGNGEGAHLAADDEPRYLRDAEASIRMTSRKVAVRTNASNKAAASNMGPGGWIGNPTSQWHGSASRLSLVEPHGELASTDRLSPGR